MNLKQTLALSIESVHSITGRAFDVNLTSTILVISNLTKILEAKPSGSLVTSAVPLGLVILVVVGLSPLSPLLSV